MKTSITKFSQWLTAILLGALGFSACSDLENDQPDMYGTPTMDFQTKGCVTDTENNPIQGLRVVLTEKYNSNKEATQTFTTDAEGKFTSEKVYSTIDYYGTLTITDTDGEANGGEFKEQTINLKDVKSTLDESAKDGWYWGVVTFEANATMLKQEDSNE